MNYHDIRKDDMLNGEGLRVVLFVSGCDHSCLGCQNPQTWDCNSGIEFDEVAMDELLDKLSPPYISGLTLSGGDPLHSYNRQKVLEICKRVKHEYPNKTIWLYTGYDYEEIKNNEIMKYVDVVVDGKYEKDKTDANYEWAGSTNQRVIRLK